MPVSVETEVYDTLMAGPAGGMSVSEIKRVMFNHDTPVERISVALDNLLSSRRVGVVSGLSAHERPRYCVWFAPVLYKPGEVREAVRASLKRHGEYAEGIGHQLFPPEGNLRSPVVVFLPSVFPRYQGQNRKLKNLVSSALSHPVEELLFTYPEPVAKVDEVGVVNGPASMEGRELGRDFLCFVMNAVRPRVVVSLAGSEPFIGMRAYPADLYHHLRLTLVVASEDSLNPRDSATLREAVCSGLRVEPRLFEWRFPLITSEERP